MSETCGQGVANLTDAHQLGGFPKKPFYAHVLKRRGFSTWKKAA